MIDALPDLKLLITTGMRNASIDTDAAKARGVTVCGTPNFGNPTAGIAIGLMLELTRHIGYENARLHAGATWQSTIGPDLEGMTLGVLGLGRLGAHTANIAKAFGMKVIAWSQNLTPEKCAAAGVGYVSKDDLFRQSDFITIHIVLSPRSRGLVGAERTRPDEAKRVHHQHVARPDHRRGGAAGGAAGEENRRRRPRRVRRRAAAARPSVAQDGQCRRSRRISATSRRRITGSYFAGVVENIRGFLDGKPVRVMT